MWREGGEYFGQRERPAMISAMESTAELGHKTGSVFDRYNIVSETDLREAAKKLEQAQEKAELVEFRHTSDIVGGVPAPLASLQSVVESSSLRSIQLGVGAWCPRTIYPCCILSC